MERGASSDSGYARWNNLEEYHDGNGWSNWEDATKLVDNDPDYYHNRINAYTVASSQG